MSEDQPSSPSDNVTCALCRLHLDERAVVPSGRPTFLDKPEQVSAATGGAKADGKRHAATRAGLLHYYRLNTTAMIRCSFPDQTRHRYGFVVRTLCGQVVNVGHVCGKHSIDGLEDIVRFAGEVERHERDLVILRSTPEVLERDAAKAEAELSAILLFRRRLVDRLPRIAGEIARRTSSNDARMQEVTVERVKRGKVVEARIERFLGLAAWDSSTPGIGVLARVRDLRREIGAAFDQSNRPAADLARRLAQGIQRLQGEVSRAEEWLSRSRLFFRNHDLQLAVIASKQLAEVAVRENSLAFVHRGQRMRLSLSGLYVETNAPQPTAAKGEADGRRNPR